MKSLRIIIGSLGVGGAERHLTHILPSLAQRGWAIEVITATQIIDLAPLLKHPKITLNFPPVWVKKMPRLVRLIYSFSRLCWFFLKDRHSITHFFLPEAYLLGMMAATLTGLRCPLVMSRRSLNNYQKNHLWWDRLERFFHKRMDYILGNSQAVVGQLRQEEGVPPSKLRLIYNGINLTQFQNSVDKNVLRAQFNLPRESLIFIKVANLIPYKGHLDLLEAFSKIMPQLPPNWLLLVVGRDDNTLGRLKARAQDLGLAEHIKWLGQCQDIAPLLFMSDIGILCSHQEGFSNALLEMMAAGLGVVATNVGGNSEAVQDQVSGLIVASKNPAALSEALLCLSLNKDLRDQYGKKARIRVFEKFALPQVIDQYDEFYTHLLKRK